MDDRWANNITRVKWIKNFKFVVYTNTRKVLTELIIFGTNLTIDKKDKYWLELLIPEGPDLSLNEEAALGAVQLVQIKICMKRLEGPQHHSVLITNWLLARHHSSSFKSLLSLQSLQILINLAESYFGVISDNELPLRLLVNLFLYYLFS